MALMSTHPSSLSTLYLTPLLSHSTLSSFLSLNTQRLSASYNVLASFLQRHDIDFVVPTHGLFLFARLARKLASGSVEEEDAVWRELEERVGVKVAPGRGFNGVEKDAGWARIRFSVGVGVMEEAVKKLEKYFAKSG
jgi:aspartate/methionine/tyrosine aminotransferase